MARPKEFDRDKALETARDIFWQSGFSATSTDDLRLAMGIGRQSFYDTFKGKRELYLEVIKKYNAAQMAGYADSFRRSPSPIQALRELLISLASEPAKKRALGCLGISSVCEFGTSDNDITKIHHRSGSTIQSLIEEVVEKGKSKGELRKSLDTPRTTKFLLTVLSGLKVAARGGASPNDLRDIALVALDGISARKS